MCEHERLKTVGNRVFCMACGKELDMAFLMAKNKPKEAAQDAEQTKSPAKKRTAKKAEKQEEKA